MSSTPRAFQNATVGAAVAALTGKGSRRFLVADEVGLGKTTVAREVVRQLSRGGRKKFTVYYVTSNARVSDQNAARLVDFLEDKRARLRALSKVDRLSMIPLDQRPNDKEPPSPLRLYSLSPQTSFPPEGTRPTPGAAIERAFLSLLLERAVPGILETLPERFIQQRATVSWEGARRTAQRLMGGIDPKLVGTFRTALKSRFNPEGKRPGLRERIATAAQTKPEAGTLTVLRRLLAEACLEATPPDLIVFDEFQRFREMLAPSKSDRLGRALLGIGYKKPAMLLLSATPYRLFGESWDGKDGPQAHEELFDTIEFLTRSTAVREDAEQLFASFGEILRAIGDAEGDTIDPLLKERAEATRDRIDRLLRPCIARTERPPAIGLDHRTQRDPLALSPGDLHTFRHFASKVSDRNKTAASAYWLSVPLPAQALGSRYKIADKVEFSRQPGVPVLRSARRTGDGKDGWGSPKLRALREISRTPDLALPWVAPSMQWWPLAGPWAHSPAQKTLLFSRFRATPQSVASLISLGVEDAYLDVGPTARRRPWESKRLAPQSGLPVMSLFHPSPFLVRATDPLKGNRSSARYALRTVTGQLRKALRAQKVEIRSKPKKDAERARPLWNLLAASERKSGDFAASQTAWNETAGAEAVLGRIVTERNHVESIDWISAKELQRLGIRDDAAAEVETVLRGGRVHGQSSTALPMRYLRSRDNQWRIDTADTPGLSAEAVRAHLGTVRAAVEDGRHQSTDPVTLFLPADHFAVGEPAVRVSVLDLPGIAAAAPRERLLVERIARRHLPAASLILLVGHASKLGMLDPVELGRQLEELKGWMRSRLRYRLVLTYTFDQESMERRFKDMPDLEAVRAHFVEQIGLFGFPVEPTLSKRLYPLDFGKSWSDQLAKPGAYRDWAAAVRAQGLHALEEDIARSCEGDTRLRISQEVGEQTVWRVEMLRQERTDALTAARNDLRRGRAKVQVVQRTKTRWERRLDDATKARDTLNAALAGIEAVVRTQVTAIPIAVSYAPDGTLALMDEEGKPVLPHVDALTAWLQADQDKLVDACECIARTLSERAGLHPPVSASECVEAMKQAYDAQCAQLGAGKYWTWLSGQFAEDCQRLQKAALERRRVIVRTLPAQLRDAVREERSRRARRQRQAVVRCSNLDKLKLRLTAKLADSRADFRRTWNDLRQKRDALRHDQKRLADFDAHMAQGYAAESLTIGKRIIAATYEGNAAVVLANLCGLRLARQTHLLICPNAA